MFHYHGKEIDTFPNSQKTIGEVSKCNTERAPNSI